MPHSTPRAPMIAAQANGLHRAGYYTEVEVVEPTPEDLAVAARYDERADYWRGLGAGAFFEGQVEACEAAAARLRSAYVRRTSVYFEGCVDGARTRDRRRAAADIADQLDAMRDEADDMADDPVTATEVPAGTRSVGAHGLYIGRETDVDGFEADDPDLAWVEFAGEETYLDILEAEEHMAEAEAARQAIADEIAWAERDGAYGAPALYGDGFDPADLGYGFTVSDRPTGSVAGPPERDARGRFAPAATGVPVGHMPTASLPGRTWADEARRNGHDLDHHDGGDDLAVPGTRAFLAA